MKNSHLIGHVIKPIIQVTLSLSKLSFFRCESDILLLNFKIINDEAIQVREKNVCECFSFLAQGSHVLLL